MSPRSGAPVFIIGCESSGTTWLSDQLGAHPRFTSGPESRIFEAMAPVLRWPWALQQWAGEAGLRELTRDYIAAVLGVGGVKRVVEKTPTHWRHIKSIDEVFPDAHFVHIYRRPWAYVRSMRRKATKLGHVGTLPDEATLRRGQEEHMAACAVWRDKLGPRWSSVAYEVLCADQDGELVRLFGELGESAEPVAAIVEAHAARAPTDG